METERLGGSVRGLQLGAGVGLYMFGLKFGQAMLAPDLFLLVGCHRVVHNGVHHGFG